MCKRVWESGLLLEAGLPGSTYAMVARWIFWAAVSLIPVAVGIPLAFVFAPRVAPWALFLLALPIVLYAAPLLQLKSMVGDRKRAIEEELPYFCVYASTVRAAGKDFFSALTSLVGRKIFPQLEKDANMMRQSARLNSQMGTLEAVETLGRYSPNPKLKTLLLGYSSEVRAGGDAQKYLEEKTRDYLRDAEGKWKRYTDSLVNFGEIFTILLFLLPLSFIGGVFLSPGSTSSFAGAFIFIGIPAMVTGGIVVLRGMQPKNFDQFQSHPWFAAVAGLAGLGTALVLRFPAWALMVAPMTAAFGAYGWLIVMERHRISDEEEGMVNFLRDITEYQKMGRDLPISIRELAGQQRYTKAFNAQLNYVANKLESGELMSAIHVRTRSRFVQVSFFCLGIAIESGGQSAKSFELLTQFASEVRRQRQEAVKSMTFYKLLSVATPVGLAAMCAVMIGLTGSLATSVSPTGAPLPAGFGSPIVFPLPIAQAIIISTSVAISLLTAYATSFTLKDTSWVAINLVLAAAAMAVLGLG